MALAKHLRLPMQAFKKTIAYWLLLRRQDTKPYPLKNDAANEINSLRYGLTGCRYGLLAPRSSLSSFSIEASFVVKVLT